MARGKLIVLEGSEAAGKKTQALLLVDRLVREGKRAEYVHFPTYSATRFGDMITRYLRGEFGPKEATPPEVGALLYALDRYQFKKSYEDKLRKGVYLVADRYTPSNIFQAAKENAPKEQMRIAEWTHELESRMPKPQVVIVFDSPPGFSLKTALKRGPKTELGGQRTDIHESDPAYLAKVRALYLAFAKRMKWPVLEVAKRKDHQWHFEPREEIHARVWRILQQRKVL